MVAGYIAFKDSAKKGQQRALFLLLFSTLLMVVNMRWRRFAEYFPPFAVLFAAFALEPVIRRARARHPSRDPVAAECESDQASGGGRARPPDRARLENARAWDVFRV